MEGRMDSRVPIVHVSLRTVTGQEPGFRVQRGFLQFCEDNFRSMFFFLEFQLGLGLGSALGLGSCPRRYLLPLDAP